ncbi:MAG: VOC family protein [Gemmatimonadota bacterium]
MPRVVHFELCADDPERAAAFYGSVFGWEVRKWEGDSDYWLVLTGEDEEPGINGGLVHRQDSLAGSANIIDVPSLDGALMRIQDAGGTVVFSRRTIPGVGHLAWCRDTEGNAFGIMERDDTAA